MCGLVNKGWWSASGGVKMLKVSRSIDELARGPLVVPLLVCIFWIGLLCLIKENRHLVGISIDPPVGSFCFESMGFFFCAEDLGGNLYFRIWGGDGSLGLVSGNREMRMTSTGNRD